MKKKKGTDAFQYLPNNRMALEIEHSPEGLLASTLSLSRLDRAVWKGFKKLSISGFLSPYHKSAKIMFSL